LVKFDGDTFFIALRNREITFKQESLKQLQLIKTLFGSSLSTARSMNKKCEVQNWGMPKICQLPFQYHTGQLSQVANI
jgi:hypothetical protein